MLTFLLTTEQRDQTLIMTYQRWGLRSAQVVATSISGMNAYHKFLGIGFRLCDADCDSRHPIYNLE